MCSGLIWAEYPTTSFLGLLQQMKRVAAYRRPGLLRQCTLCQHITGNLQEILWAILVEVPEIDSFAALV